MMRIPRHWTKASYTGRNPEGKELTCTAWGWSFNGLATAQDEARSRAQRMFDSLINGRQPNSYEYSDRPLREEIIHTLRQDDRELAIITRNRYGALVLNTASVLFVDIDFPRIKPNGLLDAILLSISGSRRRQRQAEIQERTLKSVRDWSQFHPKHAFRVYRTYAGLRLLFVDERYDPSSEKVSRILSELGSDPLYRTLTSKQECFRARLTAKPWRCGTKIPPNQYPWVSDRAEQAYRAWEERYTEITETCKACDLLESYGTEAADSEILTVLKMHDDLACAGPEKRLA
jgi:hypothetical protein